MEKQNYLGEYKSIFNGVDDQLQRDLFVEELKKDHRRPIKKIKRVVAIRYWFQITRWILQDFKRYQPIFIIALGTAGAIIGEIITRPFRIRLSEDLFELVLRLFGQ